MKATGIVRRIDDLGRVVIPKEIRRTFHIKEGDSLEIYTDRDGEVIFKKYSPMNELSDFAAQICESLSRTSGAAAAICDRDCFLAASGSAKRELCGKRIGPRLEQLMENRGVYASENRAAIPVLEDGDGPCAAVCAPIISAGDVMGGVLFVSPKDAPPLGETELKLAQTVAGFLGRQMEE